MKNIKNIIEQKNPPEDPNVLWLKDDTLYKSTSKGWVPLNESPSITEHYEDHKSTLTYTGSDGKEHAVITDESFTPNSDGDIVITDSNNEEHTIITEESLNTILSNGTVVSTTWQQLKDLRDNSQLVPGSLYRITDYQCTTTQENTRSAGHQFDIVLLALSKNKLAEEGWAMMNESNIYDVTFEDGVTRKCWYHFDEENYYNFIDCETLLACDGMSSNQFVLNDTNKTATCIYNSTDLVTPDIPYNYFQNSNLSAWKVWYCLDNDTDRFAWADDSIDDKTMISFEVMVEPEVFEEITIPRKESEDIVYDGTQYYAWGYPDNNTAYTASDAPNVGDKVYSYLPPPGRSMIETSVISVITQPTNLPNGRGVIYRLIDEFNNDVAYDFKNIQFKRALTDGGYDSDEGEDVWCYTFTWIDEDAEPVDASAFCQNIAGDEGFVYGVHDNSMLPCIEYDFYPEEHSDKLAFALNDNVFISSYQYEDGTFYGIYGNHFGSNCHNNTFGNDCYNNSFGNNCFNNTFGNDCFRNTFGDYCQNNTFGNSFSINTFGNSCGGNTFGNDCYNNSFGNDYNGNTFGNNCCDNTFGNGCNFNSFGNYCSNNSFGNNCCDNTFGNDFLSSSIGDNVNNVKVNKDYVQFILIENGNQYITITSTATTSSTFCLENFAIALGVNNSNNTKTISHNSVGDTFKTVYQNSNSTTVNV